MANPILVSAASSAVSSAVKDIKKVGEKILSEIFGCKIKPKGTPYLEVFKKAPKFFGSYGTFYSTDGRNAAYGKSGQIVVFDIVNGGILTDNQIEAILPQADRRKIEATLRKKCESVIGSYGLYVKELAISEDRGIVRLSDGHPYAGGFYSLDGGTLANPANFSSVTPIGLTSQGGGGKTTPMLAGFPISPGIIFAGLAFLFLPTLLKLRRG